MSTGSPPVRAPLLAYLLATLPPLFWSVNFVIARALRDDIPPLQMSFWRWVVAFVILLALSHRDLLRLRARIRVELPFLVVLGAVGITAFNCFVYTAFHYTTVVNAALINSLMPVMTFVLALALLSERIGAGQVLGVAGAIAGGAVITAEGDLTRLMQLAFNRGDVLVFFGSAFWALYTVLIRWRPTRLPILPFLTVTVGFGIVFHVPLVVWEMATVGGFAVTGPVLGGLAFFAVFPSVLAYILWNRAVAALGPGRTGMFMYLMPVFGVVLGVAFLAEPFHAYHAIGMALIFAGIALVTRPAKRRESKAGSPKPS